MKQTPVIRRTLMDSHEDTRASKISTYHQLSRPFGSQLEPIYDPCAKNHRGRDPAASVHFLAGLYPTADSMIKLGVEWNQRIETHHAISNKFLNYYE